MFLHITKMPATRVPRIQVSPAGQRLARRSTIPDGDVGPTESALKADWRTFKVNSLLEARKKITRKEEDEREIDLLSGLTEETTVSRSDWVCFGLPDDKEGKLRRQLFIIAENERREKKNMQAAHNLVFVWMCVCRNLLV